MLSSMYSIATKQNLSAPFQIFNSCVFNTNNLLKKKGVNRTWTGSDRIGLTKPGPDPTDSINKTWIGLRPINKTRAGSEKNRIALNFHQNSLVTSHDQVLA